MGLSVAIICRNAERTIGATIDSVAEVADEIVVLDSGSTDSTVEMVRERGVRAIAHPWLGYVGQKQAALDRCMHRWVLSIDADERLDDRARTAVREVVTRDGDGADGFIVNRRVVYAGRALRHAWQPDRLVRLVRRDAAVWVGGSVHERLEVTGRVERLPGVLLHDTVDSMRAFLVRQVDYAALGASDGGGRSSALKLVTSPVGAFLKQMVVKGAWMDGWRGWAAAGCVANAALVKHLVRLDAARRSAEEES
ncbi:MAG: glycosyltransferase family 2 protein [Planctomycetota bacterium]